jgi:HEAT repeat protein
MSKSARSDRSAESADISALIAALAHEDPVERHQAREALVAVGKPVVHRLIKLLSDPRMHVRWEAAKALGPISDPSAALALVNALEDKSVDVRWLAALGLITLGCSGLHPLLTALMDRPDSIWLREGAHHIFHDLVGKRSLKMLRSVLTALDHPEPEVAIPQAAYHALHELQSLLENSGGSA